MSRGLLPLAALGVACGGPIDAGDRDRGPIEDQLTAEDRVLWPGTDMAAGRVVLSLRGFADGEQIGYWFFGFGARRTGDSFWFCREGDDGCPLDSHRRLAWDRLVGHPLFNRIPGDPEFSPFWQMWTVRVPADFEPDSVKTIETLDRLATSGAVSADRFRLDFGHSFDEYLGPREVLLHCALVLAGTELGEQDLPQLDGGDRLLRIPSRSGWFEGHRVEFMDFSVSEGVSAAAADSESRAVMPAANVYIMFRDCAEEPRPDICRLPGLPFDTPRRAVSERGLGQDMTGDGDARDTNNVFGSTQCVRTRSSEIPYTPLWGPQAVVVDSDRRMVDSYLDETRSDVRSANDVFDAIDLEQAPPATVMMEDETGNPVPGNEGRVFFDCPFAVERGFVPYPCEEEAL